MAKKKAINQPIVAEEPAREDEQFRMDESKVAPPSARPVGPRLSAPGSGGVKSYGARSARERRAGRSPRPTAPRKERKPGELRPEVVTNMLEHPTKTVSEAQLRQEYGYVTNDLRSMAVLAVGLIIALAVLAQILPK